VSDDPDIAGALSRLDALTRKLRLECPWDREQDERSIVPHTLEEAYELADAAHARDDAKLIDELGDVLFQVHFLALLLEERGAGNLADVADHCRRKLIHRHPHVFGATEVGQERGETEVGQGRLEADRDPQQGKLEVSPRTAEEVLSNWDVIKSTEPGREAGIFGEVPENLPALLYARKLQRRAKSAGLAGGEGVPGSVGTLREELGRLERTIARERPSSSPSEGESARPQAFEELGDVLFAMVTLARELKLDPELALRAAAQRFRESLSEEKTEP
jgi:nucleoside triphosphate diphosphatase